MRSEVSSPAIRPSGLSLSPAALEPYRADAWSGRGGAEEAHAVDTAVAGSRLGRAVRGLLSALGTVGGLLAVVYAVPLVILAVGIPVALLVRLLFWTVGVL